MTIEETAHALALSPTTVKREWAIARGWLYRELTRQAQVSTHDEARAGDTCWAVSTGLMLVDTLRAASFHAGHLRMALDVGEPHRIAGALALEASFSAAGGGESGIRRSNAFAARAGAAAEWIRHPHLAALSSVTAGIAAFVVGERATATDLSAGCTCISCGSTSRSSARACALAMPALGHDVSRMRATAVRDARLFERERTQWSTPLALLIRGALAYSAGDVGTATTHLKYSVEAFDRADMRLYAAAARRPLAAIMSGDRSEARRRESDAYMAAEDIRNPASITRLLAPGFPRRSTGTQNANAECFLAADLLNRPGLVTFHSHAASTPQTSARRGPCLRAWRSDRC